MAVRDIPILTQREVEAFARMISVEARKTVSHTVEKGGLDRRLRELEIFAEASREFVDRGEVCAHVQESVLSRAIAVVSADSGTLMMRRTGTDILEVVAAEGDACSGASGKYIRIGEGIAGRVAQTGRSVLVTGEDDSLVERSIEPGRNISMAVSIPLSSDGELLGVLNVNVSGKRRFAGDEVRLLEKFADMAAVTLRNARGYEATERLMFEYMHLGEYTKALGTVSDLEEVVQTTASVLEKAFDFEIAGIALTGWGSDRATVMVRGEVPDNAVEYVLGEAIGRDLAESPLDSVKHVTHGGAITEGVLPVEDWTTMATEVTVKDTLVGYLFVAGRREGMFDGDDQRLLFSFSEYAASALKTTALFARLRDDYARTIAALSATLDTGERAEPGHAGRVMDYVISIGEELELPDEELEILRFAGILHDVGKLGVAEEILLKPTSLTEMEMEKVRRHSEIGAGVVNQIEFLDALAPIILHHHERWDGGGYPAGLSGNEIPRLARILAVADAFDAMTSSRSYRPKMTYAEARQELESNAGEQFDPRTVSAFIEVLDRQAIAGTTGLLADHPSPEDQLPA